VHPRVSRLVFAGVVAVIGFQILCPVVLARQGSHLSTGTFASESDAARYRAIARASGTPYRDFDVEYPPLALGLFHSIGPRQFNPFRLRLLALQVGCQALILFLLFRVWGKRAAWSYLVLSAPMLFVVYTTYDLVALALAVAGAALIRRRHAFTGALGFVLGAFTKVWPVVLVPSLIVRRQSRAFGAAVLSGVAGLAVWTAWGGSRAIGQVVTYRGARGWQYESEPGSILRVVTGDPLRFEHGAWRVGAPPHVFALGIWVLPAGALVGIWVLAFRRPNASDGLAEVAVITALLAFSTLVSAQFLIWPLPFVAIAAARGAKTTEPWAGAVALLTLLDWIWYDPLRPAAGRLELAIAARNIALVGLLVAAVVELRRKTPAGDPRTPSRRHGVGPPATV
jgi:Glycosyltransferase family 87